MIISQSKILYNHCAPCFRLGLMEMKMSWPQGVQFCTLSLCHCTGFVKQSRLNFCLSLILGYFMKIHQEVKLSFVLSQSTLLAGGTRRSYLHALLTRVLEWISPPWPRPHQGTPICCLCPLNCGFIALTEHKCSHKCAFWKYMALISFRNCPNSGVICGWHFSHSENLLSAGETKHGHALRTGDVGAKNVGFEGHNKIHLPPNSVPSGLAQVPDIASFFWVPV